jgi:hypothetical protein
VSIKRKKLLLIALFSIIPLFILTEYFIFCSITHLDSRATYKNPSFFKMANQRKNTADLDTLIMRSATFDPDLGFDSEYGIIRGRTGLAPGKNYFCATYGASFTYCDDVPYEQSWQYIAENLINNSARANSANTIENNEILNFAVGGYCADQAFLKFLKYYPSYPADLVIFGFYPPILANLMVVIDNFDYMLPKPRYIVKNNLITLFKPDIFKTPKDLVLLNKTSVLKELLKYDESYNYIKYYYGLDLLKKRSFPYLLEFFNTLIARIRSFRDSIDNHVDYIEKKGLHKIIKHLIDQFIQKSSEHGFFPVFLINSDLGNFQKDAYSFKKHIDYMKARGIMVIEVRKIFNYEIENKKIKKEEIVNLNEGGHYSYLGNQIIAHKLTPLLKLLKEKKYKEAKNNLDAILKAPVDYNLIRKNLELTSLMEHSFSNQDKNFFGDPVNTDMGIDMITPARAQSIAKAKECLLNARDFMKKGQPRAAVYHYKKALAHVPEWVQIMDELAWLLSSSKELLDEEPGKKAVYYAGLACEASRNSSPDYMDTLAAAYARAGKFKDAAGIAQIALSLAKNQNKKELVKKI